ncbi:TetR/AcrR family transcriptional regulator [Rhizobium leguminosarum]|uniref:TetR family transcriptional regulator n=1 Tax=Rhizobium leguminosarum TaxID=384 RepID=A0A444IBF0_RHILE|nr:TetR/AcrR family transcriptional regulator [Rhizobium leguminosarum]ASS53958.1 TetR/AcrR family transcriptional regulator [Rhizobium leguminosarum bv. viciae]AVC48782.1 bacterial regulatory, tetR family protein [Rhizobium leguminosarum bv. viciae]MBB4327768.1 TetR/AcrR family transcriptional repressor of nem operon [Rhizobium leguminosarum]MBB4341096.1 TetR/AcrR family transcriptional repressor of nem operon [Rhizobium leguminosarum]MBB4353013.1 TetR/AcrR family transcriptional repressor of
MKISREQMAENRQRILEVASRLFREKGFEAVGVAEVMKAAGLTHGSFYGHFSSKDDLIVQALAHALGQRNGPSLPLGAYMEEYLSPRHRDNRAGGCPISGLAADTLRQTPEARAAVTEGVRAQIDWMSEKDEGPDADRRCRAIAHWSAMVGATILARVIVDPALSKEILTETLAWIDDGADRPAPAPAKAE